MTIKSAVLATLLLGCCAAPAFAEPGCPLLPAGSGLQWQLSSGSGLTICKAVDAAGNRVLGVMLTGKEPELNQPRRNRAEKATIAGQEVRWYRTEIANQPGAQDRLTMVELGPDRYAQIWVYAPDADTAAQRVRLASQLDFERSATVAASP
ncbi:MAG: hypothetical protein QM601_10375 [Pseudoxanthomonas sp.]